MMNINYFVSEHGAENGDLFSLNLNLTIIVLENQYRL